MDTVLTGKYEKLREMLRGFGRVVIGFSGGVDSTLLVRVAVETLGAEHVLAVIGDSESYPTREREEAQALADAMGARWTIIRSEEMSDPRFTANPAERCYYCKSDLFGRLVAMAQEGGYGAVLDGNNADDVGDFRPGRRAAAELGVRSPLLEVGLTKAEVRELSCMFGLPTAGKPASACLASRIPYGTPITSETLATVGAAEEILRAQGFRLVRVRHHGNLARIEVPAADIPRLLDDTLRADLTAKLREIGYRYVTVDLQGYRTGSMNEVL